MPPVDSMTTELTVILMMMSPLPGDRHFMRRAHALKDAGAIIF